MTGPLVRAADAVVGGAMWLMERFASWPRAVRLAGFWLIGEICVILNSLRGLGAHMGHGDMFAQQVMVENWAAGAPREAGVVGSTNYLIKFPLYYLIDVVGRGIDPTVRFFATVLFLNTAAWALIAVFTLKLARLVGASSIQRRVACCLLLYVAISFNDLFWAQYPNSRNIEVGIVVGIVYWLARVHLSGRLRVWHWVLFALGVGLFFYSDKYSLFTLGLGAVAYFGVRTVRLLAAGRTDRSARSAANLAADAELARRSILPLVMLIGAAVGYFAFSRIVPLIVPLHIIPLGADTLTVPAIDQFINGTLPRLVGVLIEETGLSVFGHQLATAAGIRLAANIVVVGLVIAGSVAMRRSGPRLNQEPDDIGASTELSGQAKPILSLVIWLVGVVLALTAVAGMPEARYLILVPFLLILATLLVRQHRVVAVYFLPVAVAISGVALMFEGIPDAAWVHSHGWRAASDTIYQAVDIGRAEGATKGSALLLYAQGISYMSDLDVQAIPQGCVPAAESDTGQAYLKIFDLLVERSTLAAPAERTFVLVEVTELNQGCNEEAVVRQFGPYASSHQINATTWMFIYDSDVVTAMMAQDQAYS